MTWDPRVLPRQDGRTVVVTGGNAGIGYFTLPYLKLAGAAKVLQFGQHRVDNAA